MVYRHRKLGSPLHKNNNICLAIGGRKRISTREDGYSRLFRSIFCRKHSIFVAKITQAGVQPAYNGADSTPQRGLPQIKGTNRCLTLLTLPTDGCAGNGSLPPNASAWRNTMTNAYTHAPISSATTTEWYSRLLSAGSKTRRKYFPCPAAYLYPIG